MNLDFPSNPLPNETYRGSNGIVYIWDGEKWSSFTGDSVTQNLWVRDPGQQELSPYNTGDRLYVPTYQLQKLSDA